MTTEESANFFRMSALILDVGTSLLLRILKNKIQPLTLDQFLVQPATKADLRGLNSKKILDRNQFSIVSSIPVAEEKFDIALIVKILLNLCRNVVPPGTCWVNDPPDHDLSLVADLIRMRNIRNSSMLAHTSKAKISKVEFIDTWAMVKKILIRMSNGIGETGSSIEKEINDLCELEMTDLKKRRKDIETTNSNFSQRLLSIESSLEGLHEKVGARQANKELQEVYENLNTLFQNYRIDQISLGKNLRPEKKIECLLENIKRHKSQAVDSVPPKDLKDLLSRNGEIKIRSSLQLKILSAKDPIPYKNYRGDDASMKRMIVADSSAYTDAIAYDSSKYDLLAENVALKVTNIIKRPDGTLVFTSVTKVCKISSEMVKVPERILIKATSTKLVTLAAASTSGLHAIVSVQGKVVKATPTSIKRLSSDEEVSFKKLKVKDHSGTLDVTLWRELANDQVVKGDHVQLKDFYVASRYDETKDANISLLSNQRERNSLIKLIYVPDFDDMSSDCSDFEETSSLK